MGKTTTKKKTSKKANSKKNKNNILVAMPLNGNAIREWKSYLKDKKAKLTQAGRLAKIQAVLTVLNRSKEALQFCASQEAEAVATALEHYTFKIVGQPRIQYYLLRSWKELANKQVRTVLDRKNGTELELHSSAEFERILKDIELRISKGENARAFTTQKAVVEAAFELFAPLEEAHKAMKGVISDCQQAEGANSEESEEAPAAPAAAKKKTAKKAKKKTRGRSVKAEPAKSARVTMPLPVSPGAVSAAPAETEASAAEVEVEEVEDDASADEVAAAQAAALADMAHEDFTPDDSADDLPVDIDSVEVVDDDPFEPEDTDIEIMSNEDIISHIDGDDDSLESGEFDTGDNWALDHDDDDDRDEDDEEREEDDDDYDPWN